VPTVLFGVPFQGSNRHRDPESIIGGDNGIGSKLTNCFSTEFIVETVDEHRYFLQKWSDHKKIEHPPIILDVNSARVPAAKRSQHTTISFLPDYVGIFGYPSYTIDLHNIIDTLVRTRAVFAAAYANFTCASTRDRITVTYNGAVINVHGMEDIAKMVSRPGEQIMYTTIQPKGQGPYNKYPWEVVVVPSSRKIVVSCVNGVVVRDGKHIRHIFKKIIQSASAKVATTLKDKQCKFSADVVTNNVCLYVNAKIPNPSWTSQRKDECSTDIKRFKGYMFSDQYAGRVGLALHDCIINNMFEVSSKPSKAKSKEPADLPATIYVRANMSRKSPAKCDLLFVEGVSAYSQLKSAVAKWLGFDYIGVLALQGVIINTRKECAVVDTNTGRYLRPSTKMANSAFIERWRAATGLDINYKYDPMSPTYAAEIRKLKYRTFTACVDQDLDGKGCILALVLNMFDVFWPNLIAQGYVRWFNTPIVRAYPKKGRQVQTFYDIAAFECSGITSATHNIRYYKGLATHSRDEIFQAVKSYKDNIITFSDDASMHKYFEIYFGADPNERKKILSKPPEVPTQEERLDWIMRRSITCSQFLRYEVDPFQRDNLDRKLDSSVDGQNQAGRKILHAIMKCLKGNKLMRVSQIGGYVSEHESYEHGEASLYDSIIVRGFVGVGGKQLPFIVSHSFFGTRAGGGPADAGAARYIMASLNRIVKLIFPRDDYWNLPFNFDEGTRAEPKYYVPIIPLAILESTELPSHGWKLKIWARDVFKVIDAVRFLINTSDKQPLKSLPPATYKGTPYEWKGSIVSMYGKPYSVGKYIVESDTSVLITELPLRVWTSKYVKQIIDKVAKDDSIGVPGSVVDYSDDINIRIRVGIKPGGLNILDEEYADIYSDGLQVYLHLRDHMDTHLNLISSDGSVKSYKTYEDVLYDWFMIRKEYYAKRLDRNRVILQLKIIRIENIIRYVEENIKMSHLAEDIQNSTLRDRNYNRLAHSLIDNPGFIPVGELYTTIVDGSGDSPHTTSQCTYDYLLNLTDRKKSSENAAKYISELSALKAELADLDAEASQGRFPGAITWLRELDILEELIHKGASTWWHYEDADKYDL
jgi:DNA topoisomerase-2